MLRPTKPTWQSMWRILDYEMPEMNGGELAHRLRYQHPALPIILYSSSTCIPASVNDSVDAICVKGAPRNELLTMIEWLSDNPARMTDESPSALTASCSRNSEIHLMTATRFAR